ncbi:MAG: RagB/SusD family nutrient uptake outer membrane protein [Ekhidna sp.]
MNMKSYIYRNFLVLSALFLIASCGNELELQPQQSISEEVALSTPENVQAVLNGAYDEVGVSDLFGGETLRNSELLAAETVGGEITWQGTFNAPDEMFEKNMLTVNGDVSEVWLEGYETINIANNVLTGLDVFTSQSDADRVEGEAKFIRALIYFELVKFFGLPYEAGGANGQLAVPLILDPTRSVSESDDVSRNSVADVYARVIADLNDAVTLLPASNGFYATSGAAQALRARVHLQMGNYAEALADANAVIGSGNYSLAASFADAFNNDSNGPEDIFAAQVSAQDGVNSMNTYFATPQFGGRDGDIGINDSHVALYPAGDDRGAFFYNDPGRFTLKFTNQFGNVPIIRLAEMYLIRAECNVRGGTSTGDSPLNDINTLRGRANAPLLVTAPTLADVLYERRLELAFEGHRLHDIKRTQGSVGSLAYNAPELVFPIPQREMDANPNMVQNDGY